MRTFTTFISHSSADDAFVTELAASLRSTGLETWVDHENIPAGADWEQMLEDALNECDAMLLVVSPEAIKSHNVKAEWGYFLEHEKLLVLLHYKVCQIPFRLKAKDSFDFAEEMSEVSKKISKTLCELHIGVFEPKIVGGGIFISHVSDDDDFVTQLANDLYDYGVGSWVDHINIPAEADWDMALLSALKNCILMIVVFSSSTPESTPVRDQWLTFSEQDKPIICIQLEPVDLPSELEDHDLIDFSTNYEQSTLHLLRALGVNMPTRPFNAAEIDRRQTESRLELDSDMDEIDE